MPLGGLSCNSLWSRCVLADSCTTPWNIKVGSELVYVEQITGGTYGSDLVYVSLTDTPCCLSNVRDFARGVGARRNVLGVSRGGRRKWEIYALPRGALLDKIVLRASFMNSGTAIFYLCRMTDGAVTCCEVDLASGECVEALRDALCMATAENVVKEWWRYGVVARVDYIKSVMRGCGVEPIFVGERLRELFHDANLALLTSLVIDTPQGRAISLGEKIARVAELWVLARVLDVIGARALQQWWLVEQTMNNELAVEDRFGRRFTIVYQGTIKPHILKMLTGGEEHTTPDIVVLAGELRDLSYGALGELARRGVRPHLVIEVKTGPELAEWRGLSA